LLSLGFLANVRPLWQRSKVIVDQETDAVETRLKAMLDAMKTQVEDLNQRAQMALNESKERLDEELRALEKKK